MSLSLRELLEAPVSLISISSGPITDTLQPVFPGWVGALHR
jgi:hypothetical protein